MKNILFTLSLSALVSASMLYPMENQIWYSSEEDQILYPKGYQGGAFEPLNQKWQATMPEYFNPEYQKGAFKPFNQSRYQNYADQQRYQDSYNAYNRYNTCFAVNPSVEQHMPMHQTFTSEANDDTTESFEIEKNSSDNGLFEVEGYSSDSSEYEIPAIHPLLRGRITQLAANEIRKPISNTSFQCPFAGCHETFTLKRDLKKHIRLEHAEEKPYACIRCHEAFTHSQKLANHMKTKHKQTKKKS